MLITVPRSSYLTTLLLIPSLGLLIAYLWARYNRPIWPDELKLHDREWLVVHLPTDLAPVLGRASANGIAEKYGFPRWYGQGQSPYDTKKTKAFSAHAAGDPDGLNRTSVLLLIGELRVHACINDVERG
jgi:hypothetical protein